MKLILASNILEHPGFVDFVKDASIRHSNAAFVVTGDLLNVFPEPGENIEGSIAHNLYGHIIRQGLDELIRTGMRESGSSCLLPSLKDLFHPSGVGFYKAKAMARERYRHLFRVIEKSLKFLLGPRFFYIPGHMDYPLEAAAEIASCDHLRQVDQEILTIAGTKIGALGGIPNTAHPFRGVTEISPYEMHEKEYERRLNLLWGVDVLLTQLSPSESPALELFVRESPLRVLVCRAPFNFKKAHDFRGALEAVTLYGKTIVNVRPFDYPKNDYLVLDLKNLESIQHFEWQARNRQPFESAELSST